jgi:D-3-phosphoglycerate dehydrogenase / 2-oxoglutarate reductase
MIRKTIGVANPLAPAVLEYLRQRADVITFYDRDLPLSEHIGGLDGLIIRSATRIDAGLLQAGKQGRLRIVATATAGYDHIDVETAQRLAITVTNSPWGNSLANAEFIIGMMIALSRNFHRYDRQLRDGRWEPETGIGPELTGKVFATIGFGKIGCLAAEKARLLGMRVIAYDPYQADNAFAARGVQRMDLRALLRRADFLSLSIPLYKATYRLIGLEELILLKPTCYIIQSSRGGVVDERALTGLLRDGKIAGAAIDVHEREPFVNGELRRLENTILTPHIGCSSKESRVRSGMAAAEDVLRVLRGDTPVHAVKPVSEQDFHRSLG